ncbi:coiled-coil domain-containing protein 103 isoform X2 [Kogia breviceps]|uniref:coiled-coil domain-containing protein 103 isoform X2 n=1 Tax=Kogia breviceps TaxID=27615 RepID=UPI0034D1FABC
MSSPPAAQRNTRSRPLEPALPSNAAAPPAPAVRKDPTDAAVSFLPRRTALCLWTSSEECRPRTQETARRSCGSPNQGVGCSKESKARKGENLIRRLGATLTGGGLRGGHVGRLLEQLLGNHSCWAWSTLSRVRQAAQAMKRNDIIDFKALEKELQAALTADEKYKRENAAKLRAVEQRVASYEEFRGIVLASHLKPLEQKGKIGGKRTVPWNCHSIQGRPSQDETTEISLEKTLLQPETSAEFYRDWRRYLRSGPERYEALLQLGGPKLGRLFQVDVGFGLLGEMLMALADHVRPADRRVVLGILRSLASTGRFTLNLSLMSHAERESCRSLFQKLQAMGTPSLEGRGLGEQRGGFQEEESLLQELLRLYHVD